MNSRAAEAFARGIELFEAGAYFEAHEVWEEAWQHSRGTTRALLQGLIQLAAAYIKVAQGVSGGARTLAQRALVTLEQVEEDDPRVDVPKVRAAISALVEALERQLPDELLPPAPTLSHPEEEGEVSDAFSDPSVQQCPYCGEVVEVAIEPVGPDSEAYVEDCPVCCRPWQVQVRRGDAEVEVTLSRDDD